MGNKFVPEKAGHYLYFTSYDLEEQMQESH